ncbi:MAG: ATP-binding cassette domain-containing protein [Deltaproteobacteria bacterium]|nr:ATP-binding cassette domain-containing protein [Deltaproteobacteria bacterium]
MIEALQLSKNYGATRALKGVSFTVRAHEVVGLLGPNGAGKTTLMKLLTGYLQPSDGTARVNGVDVVEEPHAVQAAIGYLPENVPLYPDMLVQEYLQMIAALRQVPEEHAPRLLSEAVRATGIAEYLARPIGQLSKGYRQRVGLAQAILHRPQVLILDEPTTGLDPNQIVEIRHLIRQLAAHSTVLLSTHILSEVELTCERALIIMDGELRTDARLSELRESRAAVVRLVGAPDDAPAALRGLTGVTEVAVDEAPEGVTAFRVVGEGRELCPAIYDLARERGWRLAELRPDAQTLEAVFRGLADRRDAATPTVGADR